MRISAPCLLALVTSLSACSEATTTTPPPTQSDALYEDRTGLSLPDAGGLFTMDVALGDVDGDGDLDAILAVEFGQNRLYLNDGTGLFIDAGGRLPVASHDSEDIALADFDDDGDLDAVVVSEDDGTNEYYVNDGERALYVRILPGGRHVQRRRGRRRGRGR